MEAMILENLGILEDKLCKDELYKFSCHFMAIYIYNVTVVSPVGPMP